MKQLINLKINGTSYQSETEPRLLLVDFIRDEAGLTGTHIGCDTGHCGACTVFLNGTTVKSCMIFAVQANNGEVMTIEGLTPDGKLHPIQEAFLEHHGVQCGYCTPGMILSSLFLLQRNPDPSEQDIRRGIEGNLCRCTGYANIINAVKGAAVKMRA